MKVLGVESSCDETAAAVVEDGYRLLSNVVHTQIDIHKQYGGVVPEIAARSHIEVINPVINKALTDAHLTWPEIDAIAVNYAPGLIGSLLVGTLAARSLAVLHDIPLYPTHHVESHVYANFITKQRLLGDNDQLDNAGQKQLILPKKQPSFPMLALIVSGGHTQLMLFKGHGDYTLLGQTRDDAIGEAFDKVAKILGLPYPGGPSIATAAQTGNPAAYHLPKSHLDTPYDFSFSGLKTATLRAIQHEVGVDYTYPSHKLASLLAKTQRNDFAASFQATAIDTLVDKTLQAYRDHQPTSVVIAGGVAANQLLREQLATRLPVEINYAPMQLCTDNAAMVGSLGYYKAQLLQPTSPYEVEVEPSLSMTKTAWHTVV